MWVLIFFALNVHAQSPWLWKKLSKSGNFVLVSDQYSDTINSRTHTQINKPCRQSVIPWKRRLSPLNLTTQKMDLDRRSPLLLDAIECSSSKHSIIGYESCIFGRRFLFLLSSILRQDFCTIRNLQDPAAACLMFGVVGCRWMLGGSLPQCSDSKCL